MRDISEILDTYKICKEIVEKQEKRTDKIMKIINILKNITNINIDSKTKNIVRNTCLKAIVTLYVDGIVNQEEIEKLNLSQEDIEIAKELIKLERYLTEHSINISEIVNIIENLYPKINNVKSNIALTEELEKILKKILKEIIDRLSIKDMILIMKYIRNTLENTDKHIDEEAIRGRVLLSDFINMLRVFCRELEENYQDDHIILYVKFLKSKYRIIIDLSKNIIEKLSEKDVSKYKDYEDIIITISKEYFQNNRCIVTLDLDKGRVLYNCLRDIILLLESFIKKNYSEDLYNSLKEILLSIIREKSSNPISRRMICYLSAKEILDVLHSQFNIPVSLYDILVIFYDLYKSGIGDIRLIEDDFYLIVRGIPHAIRNKHFRNSSGTY